MMSCCSKHRPSCSMILKVICGFWFKESTWRIIWQFSFSYFMGRSFLCSEMNPWNFSFFFFLKENSAWHTDGICWWTRAVRRWAVLARARTWEESNHWAVCKMNFLSLSNGNSCAVIWNQPHTLPLTLPPIHPLPFSEYCARFQKKKKVCFSQYRDVPVDDRPRLNCVCCLIIGFDDTFRPSFCWTDIFLWLIIPSIKCLSVWGRGGELHCGWRMHRPTLDQLEWQSQFWNS